MSDETKPAQISWRLDDWLAALGHPFSKPTFYSYVNAGKIKVRKAGHNLLIVTSPSEFLASCPTTLGRSPRSKRSAAS
jgi:hypothetical protein